MPISPLVLQRRHAELGRIRLGQKTATSNGRTRPEKLSTFRFTSASERLIADIATLYGGQARPWDNAGKPEFEVLTEANAIPVIVVRGGMSQWMETWSGGGCVHRCDGVTNVLTGELCDPDDAAHDETKPTTRLSVMLRDVESLGVWRLESHGWNAAAELPMLAELAMHVGDLVPATLRLVERKAIRNGKTSRFVVPMLDLEVSKQRLVEIAGSIAGTATELAAAPAERPAIEAPYVAPNAYAADIAEATTLDDLRTVWGQVAEAGHMTPDVQARLTARAAELQQPEEILDELPAEDRGDVDGAWMALVAAAGAAGWTEPQLREALIVAYGGQLVEDLSAEQLTTFAAATFGGAR